MYMFILFSSFRKHAPILLSKLFSSFLFFFFFFNEGPKINKGFFLKQKKKKSGLTIQTAIYMYADRNGVYVCIFIDYVSTTETLLPL